MSIRLAAQCRDVPVNSDVRPQMPSFSVRCIFRWEPRPDQRLKYLYEERITLWQADDIDEAISLAEEEARTYASDSGGEYLEYCQAYSLFEDIQSNAVEAFSLLRDSDLEPAAYVEAFFETGNEHERAA